MGILSLLGFGITELSPEEKKLINKLEFNIELMTELKKETKNQLIQLPAIDQETGEALDEFYNGIHSVTKNEEKANKIVKKLKEKFRNQGYLIFVFTQYDSDLYSIAVIKGIKEIDILKYRRTDGANYNYENDDIVAKISEWDKKYGVSIIGCGRDWLGVEFKKLPTDLDSFASEVYDFCPDSVDQGVGEVENLKDLVIKMHGIWLWWD